MSLFKSRSVRVCTLAGFAAVCFSFHNVHGASVSLAWNPSPDVNVSGYLVYWGSASGQYADSQDNFSDTNTIISGLAAGTVYYLNVAAYDADGDQSAFSGEVVYNVPGLPVITSSTPNQSVIAGSNVSFAVTTSSSTAVTYQWYDNGVLMPGATNSSIFLPSVSDANAGTYTVSIANGSGNGSSVIWSPYMSLSVIDPPTIIGQPVGAVLGLGTCTLLHVTVTGTPPFIFQWYNNGVAVPGGRKSTLQLFNVGAASVGNYYATVQNSAGATTSSTVSMTISNLVIPPVITNSTTAASTNTTAASTNSAPTSSFAAAAGIYNGLFYQTNGSAASIAYGSAGLFGNCVLSTNGSYSAKVYISGTSYTVTGTLNSSGKDTETISPSGASNLTVTIQADLTGLSQLITGSVSNTNPAIPWTAQLVADLATNGVPVAPGTYTMMILPNLGLANTPQSPGIATILVNSNGTATISARVGDNATFSQSVPLSGQGLIPLYAPLYGGAGLIEGWINLSSGVPCGSATWIRPAGVTTIGLVSYPLGFTNTVTVN